MVWILSPPGVSNAHANKRRAAARRSPSLRAPTSWISLSHAASSRVVYLASVSYGLVSVLAAAALVNVRQRIFPGSVPSSNRRITRCASTWVLPEPALAETHADTDGSEASR